MNTSSEHDVVIREIRDGVQYLTLNRPEARNALSPDLREALRCSLLAAHDDPEVRCVVLTGAGGNFCAGGDVKQMGRSTPAQGAARVALGRELVDLLRGIRVPTIAAVSGHALGAGLGLALATDLTVVDASAKLQCGFIKRGLAPDSAVSYLLARQLGARRAMYYAMTSEVIDAGTAVELGLAAHRYSPDDFASGAHEVARALAAGPTAALFATRKVMHAAADLTFAQSWDFESFAAAVTTTTSDHKESVASFKNKTTMQFTGE